MAVRAEQHEDRLNPSQPTTVYVSLLLDSSTIKVDFHQNIEFGIVLEGHLLRQFEGLSYIIGPGDVWLCAMWEPHGWAALTPEALVIVALFNPEFLGDERFDGISWLSIFSVPPRDRPRVTSDKLRTAILAISREMVEEIKDKPCAWMDLVRLNLLKILLMLSRNWEFRSLNQATRELSTNDLSLLLPAMELLHSDPTRRIKVSEAADACGLCKSSFTEKFKHAMGMTFHSFQIRARLGFVAQQLIATDFSVEAIARESGFEDASHLIRIFSKYYNCTPAHYRQRAR